MILKQGISYGKQNLQKHLSLHHELVQRMMDNLHYMKIQPQVILDWGCYDGFSTQGLKRYFSKAHVIAVEQNPMLCQLAKKKSRWLKPFLVIDATAEAFPLAHESVDMIFAHQVFYPMPQLQTWLTECFRVLKPEGCLIFSTFGPDTFKEFSSVRPWNFSDLHDIGDELLRQGFLDPVMSRQDLKMRYAQKEVLKEALAQWNIFPASIEESYLTYELVFAQAWRASQKPQSSQEQTISLASIRKKLSNN